MRGENVLRREQSCGKIKTNQGWLMCPVCGKMKLARVLPTTSVKDLALYCKHCGKESVVNILPEPEPRA